jgi:hypothetical protein
MVGHDRFEELKQMSQVQLEAVYTERYGKRHDVRTDLIRGILQAEFPGLNLLFLDMGEPESFNLPKFKRILPDLST